MWRDAKWGYSIKALFLILAMFCAPSFAQDQWSGSDKKAHFGISFVLGFAAGNQWPNEPLKAFGVAMIPGVLKEISDRNSTGFSGKDLAADAIGAALGVYASGWIIKRSGGTTTIAYAANF